MREAAGLTGGSTALSREAAQLIQYINLQNRSDPGGGPESHTGAEGARGIGLVRRLTRRIRFGSLAASNQI